MYWYFAVGRARSGRPMMPRSRISASPHIQRAAAARGTRPARPPAGARPELGRRQLQHMLRPLESQLKRRHAGTAAPCRSTISEMWPNSVGEPLRNFRRAGVLKKRLRTSTVVPTLPAAACGSEIAPPRL